MNTLQVPQDDVIEGLARVVAVDGTLAWLAAEQPSACGSCATGSTCSKGKAESATRWCVPRTLAPGQAPLALGEQVRVGVDRSALNRATLTAYALPLVTMLAGVIALQDGGDIWAIMGALGGLLAGIAGARTLVRRWHQALVPVVLGRAISTDSLACSTAATNRQPGTPHSIAMKGAIAVVHKRSL